MTHSLRFVVMEGSLVDYPAIFGSALSRLGVPFSLDTYPHIEPAQLTRARLSHIRSLLRRRSADEIVFFCPGPLEHFVKGADMSFQFSAYRSWFDSERIEVLPHPWTQAWHLADRRTLAWREKPPCTIGFMGSAYRDSRAARLAAKLPRFARSFLLQGRLVRSASRVAVLDGCNIPIRFMQSFARFEALEAVAATEDPLGESTVEIVDTNGFDFSEVSRGAFARHLAATTYVLCPRGAENYSFRAYEALRFGRVPVIIDADMVLPQQIDWGELAIIVPSDRPNEIRARIIDDHRRLSSAAFVQRQADAFAACDRLDGDGWLADSIQAAIERVKARRGVQ